jgi:methyltransferase-like protein 6
MHMLIDNYQSHELYSKDRCNAFVCDVVNNDLCTNVPSESVDLVTMIFMLSAIPPEKMDKVVENVKQVRVIATY